MLTIQEKMAILRLALGFAWGGCLNCIDDEPPPFFASIRASSDWHEGVMERHENGVKSLMETLKIIGLEGAEVDNIIREKLGSEWYDPKFSKGRIGGCITKREFLPLIEELLSRKFLS